MKQFERKITAILRLGTLISAVAFIGATLVQIYARFFLESAPSWTEEAARIFFIYTMSFAAGLALKDDYYVHLDLIYRRLNSVARKRLEFIILFLITLLFGVVAWFSVQFIYAGLPEKSPSMGISMAFSFAAIFIMSAGIAIYSLLKMVKNYR